jgi:gliding motility-associated transport system ATP-binding protein
MIKTENIVKKYGKVKAVDKVSINIGKGEIVGLLGPNGAGKTTIMKILTGYHFPSDGKASINGFDVYENPLEVKQSIGYLPEMAPLYNDLNVHEYLSFISDVRKIPVDKRAQAIDQVVADCGLEAVLYRQIEKLSKGYRQRVGLAQAIIHSPDILILDEPTTGLDPNQIIEIRKLIKKLGEKKTVILSTHILQEVEAVCNRVFILNKGSIVAEGTADEIRKELKGDNRYSFEVKAPDFSNAISSLNNVNAVNEIIKSEEMNGVMDFKVSVASDSNAGEEIFDWAVANGYKLLSMVPVKVSLEDIFIKLTN